MERSLLQNRAPARRNAFTIVELLVVVGIIVVMMALLIPAFNAIKGGGDITKAAYDVAGILEQARAYAMGNNTYVWVGIVEENASLATPSTPVSSASDPGGRVILCAVASKDGRRYKDTPIDATNPPPLDDTSGSSTNRVRLIPLGKLVKLENVHIGALNNPGGAGLEPQRPGVKLDYQVGDPAFSQHRNTSGNPVANPTTFRYPLGSASPKYTFVKIIEFNSYGEVSKIADGDAPQPWIELAIQPTKGSTIDPRYAGTNKAAAAIQIEGITGRVQMLRQ